MRRLALLGIGLAFGLLAACSGTENQASLRVLPPAPVAPTYTASFECEDGNTPVQNAVCGNQQLAALDVQMASVFREHMGTDTIFQRDQVLAAQRAWALGLAGACNVTAKPAAIDPAVISCLAAAYEAQTASLESWPAPQGSSDGLLNNAIDNYVHYKRLDAKQPELCAALGGGTVGALSDDGAIDPARLDGAQEIAGSHGSATGIDPQGGTITVDQYRAGLYGGYQIRARSVMRSGSPAPMLGPTSVGDYLQTLPNGGGRFVSFASQTGDYGAIDVFTLDGQLVALITDTIGYNSPAPPGEAAVAALFTITQNAVAPACLFETYLMPPPTSMGTFAEQPSLTPFLALIDSIHGPAPVDLAPSDRQDTSYFSDAARWMMFNMPLAVVAQAKAGNWTGWLRYRHDEVLDSLYAWSEKGSGNQAMFNKLFALLRPAATDLETIYVQQQGLTAQDAEQATALAMMELLYQSTTYLAPGLGSGPADPSGYSSYKPRYPILANPQS